jgi:hypothetical protein
VYQVDIAADLNDEDETGYCWTLPAHDQGAATLPETNPANRRRLRPPGDDGGHVVVLAVRIPSSHDRPRTAAARTDRRVVVERAGHRRPP